MWSGLHLTTDGSILVDTKRFGTTECGKYQQTKQLAKNLIICYLQLMNKYLSSTKYFHKDSLPSPQAKSGKHQQTQQVGEFDYFLLAAYEQISSYNEIFS